ncbi:MAG: hypothetical protein V3R99_09705 [Thermoguttaceae bacterium]
MTFSASLALMLCLADPVQGSADAKADEVRRWLAVCEAYATDYEFSFVDRPGDTLRALPHPVLRHSQATRGSVDIGAVWLWVTADGRPGVIGTVFVYPLYNTPYHNMIHEFHALADEPLVAVWRKKTVHQTDRPALQWKPFAGAPPPAQSSAGRLRQAKALARRFEAYRGPGQDSRWQLRLIPAPLYHYDVKETNTKQPNVTLGGALFAICQGTDPEVILAVEARRVGDIFQWHYGFGGFSDKELHVRLDDAEVWNSLRTAEPDLKHPHWGTGFSELTLPEEKPSTLQR